MQANAANKPEWLDEVSRLLGEIRSAWLQLPQIARPGGAEMSTSIAPAARNRSHLRLVAARCAPVAPAEPDSGWRRVAAAILASTWDVTRHLREQRWGRVNEEMSERRELLGLMRAMQLDANGRSCLRSLDEAALESERAIAAMMGKSR